MHDPQQVRDLSAKTDSDHPGTNNENITFERFKGKHIPEILVLMNLEGWYYYDEKELLRYLNLKDVCYVLLEGACVIGCIFSTNYGNQAWLGNILVQQDHRGKGLGQEMINLVVEELKEMGVKTFRLGSVPLAIGLYRNIGFHAESFTTAQVVELPLKIRGTETGYEPFVRRLRVDDLEEICRMDERFFKSNRLKLFTELFRDSIRESCLCLEIEERIVGFIMIRRRSSSKTEEKFQVGPDHVYRLGPSCVLPKYGIDGFRTLFREAIRPINSELAKLEGNARIYVVFPRNADRERISRDLLMLGKEMGIDTLPEGVFTEHDHIFSRESSNKNESHWIFMEEVGFRQEYFEQVMSYTPDEPRSTKSGERKANDTMIDPEGIFASATPGDKA